MVTFTPTFDEYLAAFRRPCAADAERHSLSGLVALAEREQIGVIVLANPCNPTGRCHPPPELMEFLDAAERANLRVVVDESFIDFAGEQSASVSGWVLANRASHVLIIKSLSKSLGVPGLRLGYCLSSDAALVAAMNARLPIWNTNSVAEYFLELLLKYRIEIDESFQRTIRDREAFWSMLSALDFLQPFPSGGNFVMCRLAEGGPSAAELARRMLESSGIYIKDCTPKFASGRGQFVRFSVRMPDENIRLISELKCNYRALAAAAGA